MTQEEFDLRLDEAEQKAKVAGKKAFSFIPSLLLLLVVVSLTSISALFHINFDLKEIIVLDLVVYSGLRIIVMVLSKYVGADMRFQRDSVEDDVKRVQSEFLEESRKLPRGDFEKWVEKENRTAKVNAYRDSISSALEKKLSKRRRLLFSLEKSDKRSIRKKLIKIDAHVEDLQYRLSDEYIVKNICHEKVKYTHMNATDFLTPKEYSVKIERYGMSAHDENMKAIAKGIPSALLFVVIGAMLSFDVVRGNFNAMSALFDVATILFNLLQGWSVVGRKTVAMMIAVYEGRKGVISRFFHERGDGTEKSLKNP